MADKTILDFSMSGLEGGQPRLYKEIAPAIAARIYKEPWRIVEVYKVGKVREK